MRIGRSHFNKDDYVSYNPVTKKSTCLLCKKVLSGIVIHNIKRHYDRVHGVPMVKRFRRPSNTTTPKAKNKATTAVTATPLEDATIVPPTTSNSEAKKLNLNKNEFLKCCVGLVTVNNLPLRIFDDKEFFKKLIGIYEEEFHLDLNSKNIIESVEFWSDQIKQKLKGKLHQKLLCLSIDVANRMKENVATINVHLMERYRIMTYTLGVVELKSKFRSHFLKDEILKCLREYDIELKQVYSITGDSRGCSIAALKLLQQESESEQYENDMEMEEEFESSNADNFGKSTFFIIKNGYHAIKLVVHALLDTVEANLQECRTLVGLITEKYGGSSDTTISMPSLDNTSRWESTYEMIFALKEFLTHYEMGFKIEWSFVESFIEAIRPFIELTKLLDSRDYIIGDFYRDWLVCEVKLKKMVDNECAGKLLPIMMDMKQKMINNEAFNAALYLDPRFNYKDSPYFNEERRKMAVDNILSSESLADEMKNITPATIAAASNECQVENEFTLSMWTDDPYNILEEELLSISKNTALNQENLSLRQKFENLAHTQRQPFATNILDYWKNHSTIDGDIQNAVKTNLAIPIGLAEIERAQTAVTTVLTKQKSNISAYNLKSIILVKLNGSILSDIEV